MPIFRESHPLTSITLKVNQITESVRDDVDDAPELHIQDLLELIKVQNSAGVSECTRAVRKKIKYGSTVREQTRALDLLELLISNAGPKIAPSIASDEKLVEILKGILRSTGRTGNGYSYNKEIVAKVRHLAVNWRGELEGMKGMEMLANLARAPTTGNVFETRASLSRGNSYTGESRGVLSRGNSYTGESRGILSRGASFTGEVRGILSRGKSYTTPAPAPTSPKAAPPPPSRSTKPKLPKAEEPKKAEKPKKSEKKRKQKSRFADPNYAIPQINYAVEAPKIRTLLAKVQTDVTALENSLLQVSGSPQDDKNSVEAFEKCKKDRRKVLRYIQYVGAGKSQDKSEDILKMDNEFLGTLISSNELLVSVFKKFDSLCGYTSDNPAPESSDESYYTESDEEVEDVTRGVEKLETKELREELSGMRPGLNKTDTSGSVQSDPFGDGKAA